MEGDTDMSRERKPLTDVSTKASSAHPMSRAAELAALLEAHRGERSGREAVLVPVIGGPGDLEQLAGLGDVVVLSLLRLDEPKCRRPCDPER